MEVFSTKQGQGEDIVLLHGGCDDHRYLLPIAEAFADAYCFTLIDQPGCGKSLGQPQIKNINDIVDAILPALPSVATYIGWSMGGLLAIALAARHPQRVRRIINISSSPKFITDEPDWPGIDKPGFSALLPDIETNGLDAFLNGFFTDEFAEFSPKPDAFHRLQGFLARLSDINAVKARLNIVDETDLRADFAALDCPIDVILGEHDGAVPLAAHEAISDLNPAAKLHVIQRVKHMMMWTHPEIFNSLLRKILQS